MKKIDSYIDDTIENIKNDRALALTLLTDVLFIFLLISMCSLFECLPSSNISPNTARRRPAELILVLERTSSAATMETGFAL